MGAPDMTGSERVIGVAVQGRGRRYLDLHDLLLFTLQDLIDTADIVVGDLLNSIVAVFDFVSGYLFLFFRFFQVLDGQPAVIAY